MWVIMEYNKIEMKDAFLFREPHPAPEISGIGNCWLCLNYVKNQLEPLLCQRKKRDLGCVFGGDLLTVGPFSSMYGIYLPLKM